MIPSAKLTKDFNKIAKILKEQAEQLLITKELISFYSSIQNSTLTFREDLFLIC